MEWERFSNPSKRARSHKDIEFHVGEDGINTPEVRILKTWDDAAGAAVIMAISRGGVVYIDVVIWSETGARWWEGDDGVSQYREDPEASIYARYEVRGDYIGRVA